MSLIRPLYCVNEDAILAWVRYNGLHFLRCACRFTELIAQPDAIMQSKRREVKKLIRDLAEKDPCVEMNLFRSTENVHLDTMIAYKQKGVRHSFLDTYDKNE